MKKLNKIIIPAFALTVAFSSFNVVNAMEVTPMEVTPKEVKVTLDNKTQMVTTNAVTVEGLLNNFDYTYKPADEVNRVLTDMISEDMDVVVNTEKKVTILLKGKEKKVMTKSATVQDFLNERGIELGEDDSVIPSLDSTLKNDDKVMVIYNKVKNASVKNPIPNETIKKFSFDVPYGEKKVSQKGKKGVLEKKYKRVLKNDILISEELISKQLVKKPVEKIVLVGTKEVVDKKVKNETIERKSNSLYEGETKVIQKGHKGTFRSIYKNTGEDRELISKEIVKEPVEKIVEVGTKKPVEEKVYSEISDNESYTDVNNSSANSQTATESVAKYTLKQFRFNGVVNWGGTKFTYYSQSVLPGGGLSIPGRHVNSAGYVSDSDGYIAVAANRSISKGTIVNTPFGYKGKVYDICAGCTPDWIDVYVK